MGIDNFKKIFLTRFFFFSENYFAGPNATQLEQLKYFPIFLLKLNANQSIVSLKLDKLCNVEE